MRCVIGSIIRSHGVSSMRIGALLARGEQVFGYAAGERVFANPIDHNRAGLF